MSTCQMVVARKRPDPEPPDTSTVPLEPSDPTVYDEGNFKKHHLKGVKGDAKKRGGPMPRGFS